MTLNLVSVKPGLAHSDPYSRIMSGIPQAMKTDQKAIKQMIH